MSTARGLPVRPACDLVWLGAKRARHDPSASVHHSLSACCQEASRDQGGLEPPSRPGAQVQSETQVAQSAHAVRPAWVGGRNVRQVHSSTRGLWLAGGKPPLVPSSTTPRLQTTRVLKPFGGWPCQSRG